MEVHISPSNAKDKKWKAVIMKDNKKIKTVNFGSTGEDYTIHKDPERQKLYLQRHKNEQRFWSHTHQNLLTPSYFSRWLTWSHTNIKDAASYIQQQQGVKIIFD